MSPQGVLTGSTRAWLPAGLPPSLHRVHLLVPKCVVEECSGNPNLAGTKVSVNSARPWHALICTVTALQLRREGPTPLVSSRETRHSLFVGSFPGGDSVVPSP